MPDKEFPNQVKRILKRIPGTQWLNIRHEITRIHELSDLIRENRIVVLRPYSGMGNDEILTSEIVHDVAKDLFDVYGTVRLARATAAAIETPTGAILLYAPLALLRIPSSYEEYLEQIGYGGRRKIRKAERQGCELKELLNSQSPCLKSLTHSALDENFSKLLDKLEPMVNTAQSVISEDNTTAM